MKLKRLIALCLLCGALPLAFAQSGEKLADFAGTLSAMNKLAGKSFTFGSVLGLNWSDAYIGNILNKAPVMLSVPPHFGVGISVGASGLENMGKLLNNSISLEKASIPTLAGIAELRLGGFVLPFDIGFKVDFIPAINITINTADAYKFSLDYKLAGFDIRYAILEDKLALPALSVGVGFNYSSVAISASDVSILMDNTQFTIEDTAANTAYEIALTNPSLEAHWKTPVLDFKAQLSKKLLIFTPYLGLGVNIGWTKFSGRAKSELAITENGAPADAAAVNAVIKQAGLSNLTASALGMELNEPVTSVGFRVFGGLAFNMGPVKLDFTGLYNFLGGNIGVNAGLRVQI